MTGTSIYSGFQVCSKLKANEKCFRLQEYSKGEFVEIFHEHVPKHRISNGSAGAFLRTLLLRRSPFGDAEVLRTFLNNRGKDPSAIEFMHVNVEYPEPGVIRKYSCTHSLNGWFDEVINSNDFRNTNGAPK